MTKPYERAAELARERAERSRAAFREAVTAIQTTIEDKTERVEEVVQKTRTQIGRVDGVVKKHPWLFLAAAVTFGVAMGVSGGARKRRRKALPDPVVVVPEPKKHGLLRTLLGFGASLALKLAMRTIEEALEGKPPEGMKPPSLGLGRPPPPRRREPTE